MKRINTMLVLCIVLIAWIDLCFAAKYTQPMSSRIKTVLNPNWKYYKGDATGAEDPGFNDAGWEDVGIPHSFSIPYWRANSWYLGYGWYRKHFTLSSGWSTRRVFIEFEAAFQHAWVYVNGTLAGEHKGGYTAFSFDITDKVNFGGDNVIAVRLNCQWDGNINPRAGEHQFSGGIYRDVYLTVTDPVHITYYGTFAYTPFNCPFLSSGGYTGPGSYSSAPVTVKTEVKNESGGAKSYTVKSYIADSTNEIIDSSMESSYTINDGSVYTFIQSTTLNSFKLWSPSSPYLYKVYTEVYDGTTLLDTYETPLGIRWIQWTADAGFYLNGSHLYLLGFNVHQDHEGWCDAITQAASYRDVKMCKDAGCNFIRGSHYPHSQAFSDACDKLGIVLWSELPFWGIGSFSTNAQDWHSTAYPVSNQTAFEETCSRTLQDMIRQRRNHPSIIVWSIGNEIDYTDASAKSALMNYVTKLDNLIHAEDSTRPSGLGMGYGPCSFQDLDDLVDVAGYNGGGLGISDPGFPNMVSEYGSVTGYRPGDYNSGGNPSDNTWRAGEALWCAFHHGSHYGMGHMGCIDYDRIPQRRWYWYRNEWAGIAPPDWPSSGTPAKIQLTADVYSNPCYGEDGIHTISNDGTEDCMIVVRILNSGDTWISNEVPVTLKVISGQGMFATGDTINVFTPWGLAGVEFRSYSTGITVIRATSGSLEAGEIAITVEDATTSINNHNPSSSKIPTGNTRLSMRGENLCQGTRIYYTITGDFSLSKQPFLNIYSLDGSLIRRVKINSRSGVIQLDRLTGSRSLSTGVFICRLVYGDLSAVIKSVILH